METYPGEFASARPFRVLLFVFAFQDGYSPIVSWSVRRHFDPAVSQPASPFDRAGAADLSLQQKNAVEQRFSSWRTTRDIDVDGHDAIATADDRI